MCYGHAREEERRGGREKRERERERDGKILLTLVLKL